MAKAAAEDLMLLQCEKIVNETWSKASLHYDLLKEIIESGSPSDDHEEAVIMIAANAALQKMTLDRSKDARYFELTEMSPCGQRQKSQCPCDREICLMAIE